MLTPQDVHYGLAEQRLAERAPVLAAAYAAHPERFAHGMPTPGRVPEAVWINKPAECGCEEKNELAGCPRIDDLEGPRGHSIPESRLMRPTEEEMLLVTAH